MKILLNFMSAAAALVLAGCASTPQLAVLEPIGPAPGQSVSSADTGFLQIYSARTRAVTDLNAEEFFWNNDFGRNEFLFGPGRTDYSIYSRGQLVEHVRNADPGAAGRPARIALRPGEYEVHAQAEDYNAVTFRTVIPVVVQPGHTTVAYLSQDGEPSGPQRFGELVWLPNGRAAGWRASEPVSVERVASQAR